MNKRAYVPAVTTMAQFRQIEEQLSQQQIFAGQTTVGGSLHEWFQSLEPHTEAYIYSLEAFGSITHVMEINQRLTAQQICLHSICEPWFNDPSLSVNELMTHLFHLGERLSRPRVQAQAQARVSRRPHLAVEKARYAHQLHDQQNKSVVRACQIAGCTVSAYYKYAKVQK